MLGPEASGIKEVLQNIRRDWNDVDIAQTVMLSIHPINSTWVAYDEGRVKLNVDGSCHRGSYDIASGGVIRDHQGRWLRGFSCFEGSGECVYGRASGGV